MHIGVKTGIALGTGGMLIPLTANVVEKLEWSMPTAATAGAVGATALGAGALLAFRSKGLDSAFYPALMGVGLMTGALIGGARQDS